MIPIIVNVKLYVYIEHGYIISPSKIKKLIESKYRWDICGGQFIRTEIVNMDQLPHRIRQESDFTLLQKTENTNLISHNEG